MTDSLAERLLTWYSHNARPLPWRGNGDPYAVWVSEIMLQQTRVETVIPYYQRWMELFPNVQTLARAPLQQVLSTWEGLGYYSRARNLQRAAQQVVTHHAGVLPREPQALRRLPGIGAYTAGAIASIAFNQDVPALDGNIRRVLARLFNVELPARSPQGERRLLALAAEHLPAGRAGDYNQALMDLGASLCTPRQPACEPCPLAEFCLARRLGLQEQRPVLASRPKTPHYLVAAAVLRRGDQVLIAQRPLDGLLGGLWEFPGGKLQPGEDLPACLRREIHEELGVPIQVGASYGVYRHVYTHFRVTLHAFACRLLDEGEPQPLQTQDIRWVQPGELQDYPMGKIDRQIAQRLSREVGQMPDSRVYFTD